MNRFLFFLLIVACTFTNSIVKAQLLKDKPQSHSLVGPGIPSVSRSKTHLTNSDDSISYAFGLMQALSLQSQGFESFNNEHYCNGFADGYDSTYAMSIEGASKIVAMVFQERERVMNEQNKTIGENFLKNNKLKDGMGILPSGIQYEILKNANGEKPTLNSSVTVNYKGTFINGKVFDSSAHGSPMTFVVKEVIKGWQEVLPLMSVGSKWRVYVPFYFAYGEKGVPKLIPPYSTLIFEIELLSFNK